MVWPYYTVKDCNLRWTEDYPATAEWRYSWLPIFRIQQQQQQQGSVFFLKTPPARTSKENQQGHAMHLLPIVALLSSLVKDKPCSQSSLLSIWQLKHAETTATINDILRFSYISIDFLNWSYSILPSTVQSMHRVYFIYYMHNIYVYIYMILYDTFVGLCVHSYKRQGKLGAYIPHWMKRSDQSRHGSDKHTVLISTVLVLRTVNKAWRSLRCQHQCWSTNKAPALHSV